MKRSNVFRSFRCLFLSLIVGFALSEARPCLAQEGPAEDQQDSHGWRRVDEPKSDSSPRPSQPLPPQNPPSQFELPAGTWLTVRLNEPLSSDHNRPGDVFTATVAQPLVVEGFVIARRGQTIAGQVTEAQKAGRFKGTSRLGVELTEITLVDGQQLPVRTQLIEYTGGTSVGRDATAIATTAGLGAAVGAAAEGGFGAGMGALAGAGASTIGVLLTRGRATVVYPEATLTFRTLAPVPVSTERAKHAFQAVRQDDYENRQLQRRAVVPPSLLPPPMYFPGYSYWPHYSPFLYGPSFFLYSRPVFFHSRGFHRRR
jgi:hypothetical protein